MGEGKHSDSVEQRNRQKLAEPKLDSAEGITIRNSTCKQVDAIRAANPDRSDGSATPGNRPRLDTQALVDAQSESLQIFEGDHLVAARGTYNNVSSILPSDSECAVHKIGPLNQENQIAQVYAADYLLQRAKQEGVEVSHKTHDGHSAKDNDEFLEMFLVGSGNDKQLHTKRGDPVLEQFIKSPGAQVMRTAYESLGYPPSTDKLGYNTKQAFVDTILTPALDSAKHGFGDLFDERHLGNVAVQIGGFGNPPRDYPWATASATRCDAESKPNAHGSFVKFSMINIAGLHSWAYHILPDVPMGKKGPYRSIIQVFSWLEPIEPNANGK
jgi:hypothetical protein